jgi:hypothetical protein
MVQHKRHLSLSILACVVALAAAAPTASADPPPGETARVVALLQPAATGGGSGGSVGVDVRPVSAAPVVSAGADSQYEPASSIKVLVGVAAERRVAAGQATYGQSVTAYKYPDSPNAGSNPSSPSLCPVAQDEVAANRRSGITVQGAENQMLVNSDNTLTRATLLSAGGLAPIRSVASAAGMTSTSLAQDFVGCAYREGKRNVTTLADMSRFYAALDAGRLVSAAGRDHLYGQMVHGTYSAGSDFGQMVLAEARAVGLPDTVVAPFLAQASYAQKGGSYATPCGGAFGQPPVCGSSTDTRKVAADMSLTELQRIPFTRSDGTTDLRTYTAGAYVFNRLCTTNACIDGARAAVSTATREALRSVVHDALRSQLPADPAAPAAPVPAPVVAPAAPVAPAALVAGRDTVAPRLSVRRFGALRHGRTLVLRFALDEPATLSIAITHRVAGRRTRTRCMARTQAAHGRACTRVVAALKATTTRRRSGTLRLRTGKLATGRYRLTIRARDAAGNVSKAIIRSLTVARARR